MVLVLFAISVITFPDLQRDPQRGPRRAGSAATRLEDPAHAIRHQVGVRPSNPRASTAKTMENIFQRHLIFTRTTST